MATGHSMNSGNHSDPEQNASGTWEERRYGSGRGDASLAADRAEAALDLTAKHGQSTNGKT
jgi:hypothetical protein